MQHDNFNQTLKKLDKLKHPNNKTGGLHLVRHMSKVGGEILMGVGLGYSVNLITDKIADSFGFDIYVKLIMQIFFIVAIMYFLDYHGMVELDKNILFHTSFVVSQLNITQFVEHILYDKH